MGMREFAVRQGDRTLHRERGLDLGEPATWNRIQELADRFHASGVRIVVLNAEGAIVISVGVATLQAVLKAA